MGAVRLMITGRVQRVGFRAWFRHEALSLGLTGWVRNRRDGSVEATVSGPGDRVIAMLESCKAGPAGARIADVAIEERASVPMDGFSVWPTL